MPNRYFSSRLAAHTGTRQVHAVELADRAANAVERTIAGLWRQITGAVKSLSVANPFQKRDAIVDLLKAVPYHTAWATYYQLQRSANWGHKTAVKGLTATLPRNYLAAVAARRFHRLGRPVTEAVELQEDFAGIIAMMIKMGQGFSIDLNVPYSPEPWAPRLFSHDEIDQLLKDFIFPPPSAAEVSQVVFAPSAGMTWTERLARLSRLAPPEQMGAVVVSGMAAGKSYTEVTEDLLPLMDNYRASARRVSRTECLRVTNAMQHAAHEELGDMLAGYQIHAVLDEHTRPKHRHRNGKTWMKDSGIPMRVALEMEDDVVPDSFNCRCFLSPILTPAGHIVNDPALSKTFTDSKDDLIPDPAGYSAWWEDQASARRKRLAVGTRRYSLVQDLTGDDNPPWEAFSDPKTGGLMPMDRLKAESEDQRLRRQIRLTKMADERRKAIEQISTFGLAAQPHAMGVRR